MADFTNTQITLTSNSKYEILTPDGFKPFDGILKGSNTLLYIVLCNGMELKCTPLHKILINESREYIEASKLAIDDLVLTKDGLIKVTYINILDGMHDVFEVFNVHDNHIYNVNDIYSHQCLYLDEFAFIKPHIADEFIASVFPTISSGKTTQVIITSTPNGMNHFFRMWEDAIEETDIDNTDKLESSNGYIRSEIQWNAVPGRDAVWARDEMKKIGEIRFNQEYLCNFIGSVSTLIDHHFLKSMESTKPMKIANLPEYIRIYALPLKKEKLETEEWEYVASLDSGYGVYQDSTVLQIFLVKSNITAHQVAVISSNKLEIEEFCKKSSIILKKYHDPTLIIEQNGPGIAATNYFNNRLEYENLLHFDPTGNHMGLWASEKLKQNACILLKTYVQRKFLHIYDRETINELFSFGRVSQEKWGALGGNHDDHITAMYWIPYYLQSPMFYGNIVEVNMKAMEEDEYLLKTEEDILEERAALQQTTKEKMDDMRNAATYLPKQISNPHRKNPEDDDIQGSGLMFKR